MEIDGQNENKKTEQRNQEFDEKMEELDPNRGQKRKRQYEDKIGDNKEEEERRRRAAEKEKEKEKEELEERIRRAAEQGKRLLSICKNSGIAQNSGIALGIGNGMIDGMFRGGAQAFKLDTLMKS
ncbi:hypothetical protein H5410_055825 [Solanum commersonii]|uniref:Uncharacterized protein n=1 Tax=Solanum commersonii TaxID=4109 RepID=A0A9J5WIL5_SOLCO|nr:hypothetical protein H5410_055825 [Solanum commersonii]